MARIARVVAPGLPFHATQRGNRRQNHLFNEGDSRYYLEQLAERRAQGGSWAMRMSLPGWKGCLAEYCAGKSRGPKGVRIKRGDPELFNDSSQPDEMAELLIRERV